MEFANISSAELWLKIAMASACGFVLGLERQLRGKPVGIRTSTLVCLGTMSFIHLSLLQGSQPGEDSARILGQVVTGIGFLGAGVIFTQGGLVNGVTSAAVIWILAALGSAIGFGHYDMALAICLVSVSVLVGVEYLESAMAALQRGVHAKIGDLVTRSRK